MAVRLFAVGHRAADGGQLLATHAPDDERQHQQGQQGIQPGAAGAEQQVQQGDAGTTDGPGDCDSTSSSITSSGENAGRNEG